MLAHDLTRTSSGCPRPSPSIAAVVPARPRARAGAGAQPIVVKMATLVPDGTSWHLVLKEVAAEWGKISGGKVKVNLYAGRHGRATTRTWSAR